MCSVLPICARRISLPRLSLTVAAVALALITCSRSIFWGPMAVAVMGGLNAATFLTLFFLPALYVAWFKVQRE